MQPTDINNWQENYAILSGMMDYGKAKDEIVARHESE